MLVGTCWKTVSAKVAENGQTAADHRLRHRLCPRIRIAFIVEHLQVEVPCPRSPPLKPQSPPVYNLNGCLFIVEHLQVEVPCPRSPPLKPQSPPVPKLKGCLFIVEHLHV